MVKLSDLVKKVRLKQLNLSKEQINECFNNPDLTGEAFDCNVFAKQINNKVLFVIYRNDTVIDILLTDMAGKVSDYEDAGNMYQVAFSATGDTSFYKKGKIWGKITKK